MVFRKLFSRKRRGDGTSPVVRLTRSQLPMLGMAETTRNNFIATVGEFVGTFLFLFFSFAGTQVSNTPKPVDGAPPNTSNLLYSALSFGFSLTVNVWAFYRVTGGLFNPAVNLALFLCGGLPPIRSALVFGSQIVGGIAAAGVVSALFPGDLNCTTRLGGGASISQGLFIEMFLTAQLVLVVIMLAVVKHKSTFLAPVGIGLAFFVAEMIGDYYTGGSLNPARSLGPDVINRSFPGYHWIYWVGPLLGSLLACGFFGFLTLFQYHTVNPGQDYNEWEAKMGQGSWDESNGRPSRNFSDTSTLNRSHSMNEGARNPFRDNAHGHSRAPSNLNTNANPNGNLPANASQTNGEPTNLHHAVDSRSNTVDPNAPDGAEQV